MEKGRSLKLAVLIVLFVSIVGLTIAYASYTTLLNVSGSVTAKASSDSWDVHFEPLSGTTLIPELNGLAEVQLKQQ